MPLTLLLGINKITARAPGVNRDRTRLVFPAPFLGLQLSLDIASEVLSYSKK
jgi:hypothetical protein